MPEEVLFQSEGSQSRTEIASYLRRVAEILETGDDLTLTAGEQSVTITPPDESTFEVKVEREGPADSPGELSIEFEIEWKEDGESTARGSTGGLEIE